MRVIYKIIFFVRCWAWIWYIKNIKKLKIQYLLSLPFEASYNLMPSYITKMLQEHYQEVLTWCKLCYFTGRSVVNVQNKTKCELNED